MITAEAAYKKEYKMSVMVSPSLPWGAGATKSTELVREKTAERINIKLYTSSSLMAGMMVGRRRGGLAIVAVGACVFFGGVSGSGPADSAATGAILIPAMYAQGYSRGYSAALIAAGSTAIIVPPSIALIIYGAITSTSVPALFAAGAVPGFLAGISLLLPAILIARKEGYGSPREGEQNETSLLTAFREAFWGLLAHGTCNGSSARGRGPVPCTFPVHSGLLRPHVAITAHRPPDYFFSSITN